MLRSFLLALALGGCALDARTAPESDEAAAPDAGASAAPDAPVAQRAATLEDCSPALAWATRADEFSYAVGVFALDPGGDLLLRTSRFGGSVFRTDDGTLVASRLDGRDAAFDEGWRLTAETGEDGVAVREISTGEALFTAHPAPPTAEAWYPSSEAALTGDALVVATCWQPSGREGPGALTVQTFSVPDGAPGPVAAVGAACGEGYPPRTWLRVTPNGEAVLAGLADGAVALVTLATGEARVGHVAFGPSVIDPQRVIAYESGSVLAAALSPDGARLALTATDGTLRQIALPALAEAAAPLPVGIVGANQQTYMPSAESPVAFSADGRLIAHLDADGAPTIRRVADGAVVRAVTPPWAGEEAPSGRPDAVMGLRFTADGAGLAAALEGGAAMWRCPGDQGAPAPDALEVRLDGPDTIATGETATFTATVDADGPVVRQLLVDGTPAAASLTERLELSPWEPGRHVIEVVADDGRARGTARRTVTVVER